MRQRAPAAALVEQQHVVARRIEQPAMRRPAAAARAAVEEHRGDAAGRTAALPIDAVPVADVEQARGIGFDRGIELAQRFGHRRPPADPHRRARALRQVRLVRDPCKGLASAAARRDNAMSDELVFYTNPMSRARTVRWMLEEVGAPYRTEILEYGTTMKAPAYLAINPMGKVPAIVHRGDVVTEGSAICAYLADAFPEAGLAPPPTERADYYRWLFFATGPFDAALVDKALGRDDPARTRGDGRLCRVRRGDRRDRGGGRETPVHRWRDGSARRTAMSARICRSSCASGWCPPARCSATISTGLEARPAFLRAPRSTAPCRRPRARPDTRKGPADRSAGPSGLWPRPMPVLSSANCP